MKRIEDYLTAIGAETTPVGAFEQLQLVTKDFGYDTIVYSLMTDHPSLGLERMHGLEVSYPADWMNHYLANGLELRSGARTAIMEV